MNQPHQSVYPAVTNTPRLLARYLSSGILLERAVFKLTAANNNGPTVFDIHINGISLYPVEADRPTIASGQTLSDSITDFDIALWDIVEIYLDEIPSGGVGPIYTVLVIDDGESGGAGLPEEGDLNVSTNVLEKVQAIPISTINYNPAINDDFADDVFNEIIWAKIDGAVNVSEVGGRLLLNGQNSGSNPPTVRSIPSFAFDDGDYAVFELNSVGTGGYNLLLGLWKDANNNFGFLYDGNLKAYATVGGVFAANALILGYNDGHAHKFLRVRRVGTDVYFETSATVDSGFASWFTDSGLSALFVGPLKIEMQSGRPNTYIESITSTAGLSGASDMDSFFFRTNSGELELTPISEVADAIDNLGVFVSAQPTILLEDNFNDNSINPAIWHTAPAGVSETGGRMRLQFTSGVNGFIRTVNSYSPIATDIVGEAYFTPTANLYTQLSLITSDALTLTHSISQQGTALEFYSQGVLKGSITYNAINHRWWRIRMRYSTIIYETSPNGNVWTPQCLNSFTGLAASYYGALRAVNATGTTQTTEFNYFKMTDYSGLLGL